MNKRNYNKEMQDEISSIGCRKPSMLLQCCCAPCATAVINRLKDFDVTLFYYNPNTFPESEYQKRFETLKVYVDKAELGLNIVEIGYRDEDYLAAVSARLWPRSCRSFMPMTMSMRFGSCFRSLLIRMSMRVKFMPH